MHLLISEIYAELEYSISCDLKNNSKDDIFKTTYLFKAVAGKIFKSENIQET